MSQLTRTRLRSLTDIGLARHVHVGIQHPARGQRTKVRLHGPYAEWTRKIGGKTVTRRLSPAELAEYQPLFDNARKLRALLAELQDLTLQIIEETGTTGPQHPQNRQSASG